MIEMLRDFVEKAESLGIEYMVTGSFAMGLYAEARSTRDIDVVVQIGERDVLSIARTFTRHYYVSDSSIRRALEHRSIFNIVDTKWGSKIDCIVRKDNPFAKSSFERRQPAQVSGVRFWAITKEDLIIAKLDWARESHSEMQLRDVANLTCSEYDSDYVRSWIGLLDLHQIWTEMNEWKTRRQMSGP